MLFLQHPIDAQLYVGAAGGFETGWWAYKKGYDAGENSLGTDRTRHAPFGSAGVYAGLLIGRTDIGLSGRYIVYAVGTMEASGNASGNPDSYLIAENNVTFVDYRVLFSYDVLKKPKWGVSPRLAFGGFSIYSLHPQRDRFGTRVGWSAGVNGSVAIGDRTSLDLTIDHTTYTIGVTNGADRARHWMYRSGIHIGFKTYFKDLQ